MVFLRHILLFVPIVRSSGIWIWYSTGPAELAIFKKREIDTNSPCDCVLQPRTRAVFVDCRWTRIRPCKRNQCVCIDQGRKARTDTQRSGNVQQRRAGLGRTVLCCGSGVAWSAAGCCKLSMMQSAVIPAALLFLLRAGREEYVGSVSCVLKRVVLKRPAGEGRQRRSINLSSVVTPTHTKNEAFASDR
jgi:hypothetical protein